MARSLVILWRTAILTSGLPGPVKLVGLALAERMTGDGYGDPPRAEIAKLASAGTRTVDGAIQRLEAVGLLRVDRTAGGRTSTNRYQAVINGAQPALFDAGKRRRTCAVSDAETAQDAAVNGAGRAPLYRSSREDLSRAPASAPARAPADREPLAGAEVHERSEGDGYGSASEAAAAFRARVADQERNG